MQIVIDIPDAYMKKGGKIDILSGTPLPKGHGRLIDADAIKPIYAPIAPLTPEDTVHYEWVYMKSEIDRTPTIVEADGGEE